MAPGKTIDDQALVFLVEPLKNPTSGPLVLKFFKEGDELAYLEEKANQKLMKNDQLIIRTLSSM